MTLFRAAPDAVRRLLPAGVEPRTTRGYALLELCYTRIASAPGRWLPLRQTPTFDHLVLRVALDAAQPRRYVFEESTSSWLRAHLRKHASSCSRSAFVLAEPEHGLELTVRRREHELLYLRARPSPALRGSVFASARQAAEYLGKRAAGDAPQPLEVFELRAAWIDALGLEVEFDGAFRAGSLARVPRESRRRMLEYTAPVSAPYLPSL